MREAVDMANILFYGVNSDVNLKNHESRRPDEFKGQPTPHGSIGGLSVTPQMVSHSDQAMML
jgi:hypothetical protein